MDFYFFSDKVLFLSNPPTNTRSGSGIPLNDFVFVKAGTFYRKRNIGDVFQIVLHRCVLRSSLLQNGLTAMPTFIARKDSRA